MIEKIYKKLGRQNFNKDFLSLFSGNVAQAISLLAVPILANLYGPEAYAILGIFIAICSTLSPSITGKFEIAAVIADTHNEAKLLFLRVMGAIIQFNSNIFVVSVFQRQNWA